MEMVQTVTQPQESASTMPGMSGAGTTTTATADSSPFAALLQEMLPPALPEGGAATLGGAVRNGAVDGAPAVKGKKDLKSSLPSAESGNIAAADQFDPESAQLALLLAVTGQSLLLQDGTQPEAKHLAVSEPTGVTATLGEVTGGPDLPLIPQSLAAGVHGAELAQDGAMLSAIPGSPLPAAMAASSQLAQEPVNRLMTSEAAVTADTASLFREADVAQETTVSRSGQSGALPVTGNCDARRDLPQAEQSPLEGKQPAGQGGEAAQNTTESEKPGHNALLSGNSSGFFGAVQAQETYAPAVESAQGKPADAARPGRISGYPQAGRKRGAAEVEPLLAGQPLSVQGGKDPLPSQDAGSGAVGAAMELVFTGDSLNGGDRDGSDASKGGAQNQGRENMAGLGVVAPRGFDLPDPGLTPLRANGAEAKSGLHESILAQVREGVVRHDGKGNGVMTLRLNPQELGELQINVRVEAHQVKVEVVSDNRAVREALMSNLDSLKETLLKQNLNMEGFAVATGGNSGFSNSFREERGEQRHPSRIPFGWETQQLDDLPEKPGVVWGSAESSLVDLRL